MIINLYEMLVPKCARQGPTPAVPIAEMYVMDLRTTKRLHPDVIPVRAWT